MKGFNSKKSKNHKLQHWRSFLSYNNYSRNLLYVHLYLWPYKNGLANISQGSKNLCGCLLRSKTRIFVCAMLYVVSSLNPTWCFRLTKKNYNLLYASRHFFLTFFFQSWNVEFSFRKIVSHFCLEKFTGKQFDAKMSVVLKIWSLHTKNRKTTTKPSVPPTKVYCERAINIKRELVLFLFSFEITIFKVRFPTGAGSKRENLV